MFNSTSRPKNVAQLLLLAVCSVLGWQSGSVLALAADSVAQAVDGLAAALKARHSEQPSVLLVDSGQVVSTRCDEDGGVASIALFPMGRCGPFRLQGRGASRGAKGISQDEHVAFLARVASYRPLGRMIERQLIGATLNSRTLFTDEYEWALVERMVRGSRVLRTRIFYFRTVEGTLQDYDDPDAAKPTVDEGIGTNGESATTDEQGSHPADSIPAATIRNLARLARDPIRGMPARQIIWANINDCVYYVRAADLPRLRGAVGNRVSVDAAGPVEAVTSSGRCVWSCETPD
jgi:hypothetical protein